MAAPAPKPENAVTASSGRAELPWEADCQEPPRGQERKQDLLCAVHVGPEEREGGRKDPPSRVTCAPCRPALGNGPGEPEHPPLNLRDLSEHRPSAQTASCRR